MPSHIRATILGLYGITRRTPSYSHAMRRDRRRAAHRPSSRPIYVREVYGGQGPSVSFARALPGLNKTGVSIEKLPDQ